MKIESQFKLFDLVKFNEIKQSLPEAKLTMCYQHNKRVSVIGFQTNEDKSTQVKLFCQDCDFDAKKSYNLKKYLTKVLDESVLINRVQKEDQHIIQKAEQLSYQLTKLMTDIEESIRNLVQLKQKAQNLASITLKKLQLASAPLQNTMQNVENIINENVDFIELSQNISLLNERFVFDLRSQTIQSKLISEFLNLQELKQLSETCKSQIELINSLESKSLNFSKQILRESYNKSCVSTVQSLEDLTIESMTSSWGANNQFESEKQIDEIWRWGEQESLQHCVEKSLVVGCLKEFNLKRQHQENHIPSQKLLCHKCSIIYERIKSSIKNSQPANEKISLIAMKN